ncbi:MAG: type I polyketide synthase, partial [Rhodobacteraceae bacterium]|nr:type I polyketide synthase [Paracoccaceae bacterium]
MQDELVESLAAALYMEVSDIERDVNFTDMGLDSIVGVEWINVINKRHGIKVPATKVYDYPTIQQLADYLMAVIPVTPAPEPERIAPPVILPRRDKDFSRPDTISRRATRRESAARNRPKVSPPGSIAIVGMSGRYPGATDLDAFWKNLAAGHNSIREIPRERWEVEDYYDPDPSKPGKVYCKWLGALDDIDCFDAPFFMVSRAEAEGMDPQYRIFLEESHKAFEHAGYSARSLSDKNCGVYMGIMNSEYVHLLSPAQT